MKRGWIMGRVLNKTERASSGTPSAVLRLLQRVGKSGRGGGSGR